MENPIKTNTIILHFSNSNQRIRIHQPRFPTPNLTSRKKPTFPKVMNSKNLQQKGASTYNVRDGMSCVCDDGGAAGQIASDGLSRSEKDVGSETQSGDSFALRAMVVVVVGVAYMPSPGGFGVVLVGGEVDVKREEGN